MNLPVLAAWLHDIGKFAQRAKAPRSNLEHEYCPSYNGHSSHSHVLYTDYFIENILPLPRELEASRSRLADLAASHHKADGRSREHRAIQTADRLSAGMDRTERDEEGNYISERLESIFSKVKLGGKGQTGEIPRYTLKPLNSAGAIFPCENALGGANYQSLWRDFLAALQKLPLNLGVNAWQSSLVSLLERYCWCIPSATWRSAPDVSLYDHSATAAALTQALLGCAEGEEKFILFGGDLSGIQTFIFGREEPADKGAVRLLRARSFLLQAVTRSIWLSLLERLKLDHAAKIMDAGGRFALLLPGTPEIQATLEDFEFEVGKWLFEKFRGSVCVNFAAINLSRRDFEKKNFENRYREFGALLDKAKLNPFSRVFASGQSPVFPVDFTAYRDPGECDFCHTRPGVKKEGDKAICAQCDQLKNLGKLLPETRFVVFTLARLSGQDVFPGLLFGNITLRLCENLPPENESRHALQVLSIREEPVFTVSPIAGHAPLITQNDLERWRDEGRLREEDGALRFMGEDVEIGALKTFSMLAEEARVPPAAPGDPWTCVPCLGVCKADVDNLGLVFGLGLKDNFSLSIYAMLARMLNYFFAAYLTRVIEREFPDIYVIFAGGDDVFVVGPWPATINFAFRMAGDFRKFCGENPALTLSAGLPLIKPGLPMRAVREEAEGALEKSKAYHDGAKNAVAIFGEPAFWPAAEKNLATGKWLADLCEENKISRGFLRRILGYSRECADFLDGKGLAKNGLYLSHYAYDLARNRGRANSINTDDPDFVRLQKLPQDKDFATLQSGVSWAIYRTRIS